MSKRTWQPNFKHRFLQKNQTSYLKLSKKIKADNNNLFTSHCSMETFTNIETKYKLIMPTANTIQSFLYI